MTPTDRCTWVAQVMGLPVSVTVRGPRARSDVADRLVQALHADLRHADRVFSTYRADSEISLLRRGALPRELVSRDVADVLDLCEQARRLSGGHVDADVLQPDGRRLLVPSGLVKGWAVERATGVLSRLDDTDWLVHAGGDLTGSATHGPAWRVAIEDPRDRARVLCVLPLRHGAVATSGTAARGRHLRDPRTGRLAADHLLSVTVVGPSLTWTDVLAPQPSWRARRHSPGSPTWTATRPCSSCPMAGAGPRRGCPATPSRNRPSPRAARCRRSCRRRLPAAPQSETSPDCRPAESSLAVADQAGGYQPRARHSGTEGLSTPSVVSLPCPG